MQASASPGQRAVRTPSSGRDGSGSSGRRGHFLAAFLAIVLILILAGCGGSGGGDDVAGGGGGNLTPQPLQLEVSGAIVEGSRSGIPAVVEGLPLAGWEF
jgi:hypothetical protein